MSKQLTPLEALERLRPKTTYLPYYTRSEKRYYCDIIENALKRLETIDKFGVCTGTLTTEEAIKEVEEYISNKKKLKALEIIKKFPAVASFMIWALYNERVEKHTYSHIVQYCEQNDKEIPTQEQFDLLKEVLK